METTYLTRKGVEKLRRELERLVREVRPEATRKLVAAREHGDLSENAEYDAAKEDVADIDRRMAEMQIQLSRVQIIDESELTTDEVRIFSRVTLLDLKRKKEFVYTLVDPLQSNPRENLISMQSPIGKGLLGKKKGDEVTIEVPSGELKLRVIDIALAEGL